MDEMTRRKAEQAAGRLASGLAKLAQRVADVASKLDTLLTRASWRLTEGEIVDDERAVGVSLSFAYLYDHTSGEYRQVGGPSIVSSPDGAVVLEQEGRWLRVRVVNQPGVPDHTADMGPLPPIEGGSEERTWPPLRHYGSALLTPEQMRGIEAATQAFRAPINEAYVAAARDRRSRLERLLGWEPEDVVDEGIPLDPEACVICHDRLPDPDGIGMCPPCLDRLRRNVTAGTEAARRWDADVAAEGSWWPEPHTTVELVHPTYREDLTPYVDPLGLADIVSGGGGDAVTGELVHDERLRITYSTALTEEGRRRLTAFYGDTEMRRTGPGRWETP